MASPKSQLSFSERLTLTTRIKRPLVSTYPEKSPAQVQVESRLIEEGIYRDAQSKEDYYLACNKWIDEHSCSETVVQEVFSPRLSTREDSPQQPGQTIGPYINCTHHATGLFSTVYKQISIDRSKSLAIKVTIPSQSHAPHDPKREARILVAAANTNIIPLLATHILSSQFLLVFPFQQLDLASVLRDDFPMNTTSARQILKGLFCALAHIHAKGIIHRDVKPANILLSTPVGPPYLADFGIAWSSNDPGSEPFDQKITDVGTTCYRPPELLFGHGAYGPETDLWAAGCVVAECVRYSSNVVERSSAKTEDAEWTLFNAGELGSELALIKSIFETLGTPTDETWPEAQIFPDWNKVSFHTYPPKPWAEILPLADKEARDLVSRLVIYQSTSRLSAPEALDHVLFSDAPTK